VFATPDSIRVFATPNLIRGPSADAVATARPGAGSRRARRYGTTRAAVTLASPASASAPPPARFRPPPPG
jgi:hypothetical protein